MPWNRDDLAAGIAFLGIGLFFAVHAAMKREIGDVDFVAGTIATFVLAIALPALSQIALRFSAPEYFALTMLGILLVIVLSQGSLLKGLAMAALGLMLAMVGTDVFTSATRFTLGIDDLRSGVDFIAVSVGIFGVA